MRTDIAIGYTITALFVLSVVVVGAEFLFGTGRTVGDEADLGVIADPLGERFGLLARWFFLLGFFGAAYSSLVAGWDAFARMFSDLVRVFRGESEQSERYLSRRNPFVIGFLVWISFPPLVLLVADEPIFIVVIYAVLGALFLPFMAATLMWLLNSRRVERPYKNGVLSNLFMGAGILLFAILGIQQLIGLF